MTAIPGPPREAPSVAVVVLTWNHKERTLQCLGSLAAQHYPRECLHIVVVDNASTDGTVETLAECFPGIQIVVNEHNLGYAAGNNVGVRRALALDADYVFVVNNDVVLDMSALRHLVDAAQATPKAGFLGPKIYQSEPADEIQSAGTVVDRWGRMYQRGLGQADRGQFDRQEEVDALVGCAILARRTALESVGLLDERYYLYYEDTDWCLRARRAGFVVLYVPAAKVWHRSSKLRASDLGYIQYYMVRNSYLLLAENRLGVRALLRTFAKHVIWISNWTLNPKWRHIRHMRDATFRGLVDALLGRYGRQLDGNGH